MMKTPLFRIVENSVRLSDEKRVLLQQVSDNPAALLGVRRRAQALLLLDAGGVLNEIAVAVQMDRRTLAALIQRYRQGGVRSALLGQKSSLQRRNWLALSPMG